MCQRTDPGSQSSARMHDAEDVAAFDTELSSAEIFETWWISRVIRKSAAWVYLWLLSNMVHFVSAHFAQLKQTSACLFQPLRRKIHGIARLRAFLEPRKKALLWQLGCLLQCLGNPKITLKDLVSECTLAQRLLTYWQIAWLWFSWFGGPLDASS